MDSDFKTGIMKTKYPVVLVHGAGIRDTFFLRSFGNIDKELRKLGYDVTVANTDAFGTVESNAEMLRPQILKMIEDRGCEQVNIIAHSKGGLDSRYMVERYEMGDKVASLTTLCTPHKGSPIASEILNSPLWFLKFLAFFINLYYRIFGDKNPDCLTVCGQLQRTGYGEEAAVSIPGVYCQSFSSTVKKNAEKNDFVMRIPLHFSRYYEKNTETDGLVPRDSTIFGIYRGDCLNGSVSHSEIIDFMTGKEVKAKVHAFYAALVDELAKMGF
ncbi:MAG: hypothetical protein J6X87_05160 [Clostridia bacterium]|nr:hypothetical protein [Clostridia bacterium]